jgi:hypothetical protein
MLIPSRHPSSFVNAAQKFSRFYTFVCHDNQFVMQTTLRQLAGYLFGVVFPEMTGMLLPRTRRVSFH